MTKPGMYAAFPEPVSPIPGEPDVQELIRILQHLMFWAQSCKTPLSLQNILFLTLPENIWNANTQEQYPVLTNPPPPIANYEGSVDVSDRATTKAEWGLIKKTFDECINMNASLVTRFLSLINPTFKTCYELTQLSYPNASFLTVFDFFIRKYKRSNEQDRARNNLLMHSEWKPKDGFEKLATQINIGVMYAQYVDHPIPYQEIVDTFIMVITKCGLFNTSYEK